MTIKTWQERMPSMKIGQSGKWTYEHNAMQAEIDELRAALGTASKKQWSKMVDERVNDTNINELVLWLRDLKRKPAVNAFTEGPARRVAYAAEYAIQIARDTHGVKDVEVCKNCGSSSQKAPWEKP